MEEEWERRIVAAGELHLTRELERGGCESGGEGKRLRRNQGQVAEGDEDGGDVEEKEPRGRDPSRVSSRVGTWHLFGLLMSARWVHLFVSLRLPFVEVGAHRRTSGADSSSLVGQGAQSSDYSWLGAPLRRGTTWGQSPRSPTHCLCPCWQSLPAQPASQPQSWGIRAREADAMEQDRGPLAT